MPALKDEDKNKITARERGERRKPVSKAGAEAEAVPLEVVIGQGIEVDLYGHKFEIAPYLLGVAGKASKALDACPLAVVAYGYADDVDTDLSSMVEILNKMTGRTDELALTVDAGEVQLDTLVLNIPEESVSPMLDAATLAIQRRHPDFTRHMAEQLIDMTNILNVFRAIFQVNRSRKKRF